MTSRANEALVKYIEWLNLWQDYEAGQVTDMEERERERVYGKLTMEMFHNYPGTTKLLEVVRLGRGEEIVIFDAGYGDEGGSATMIAKFENADLLYGGKSGRPAQDSWQLQWIVQEFDSMGSMIYSEGKFFGIPEEVNG